MANTQDKRRPSAAQAPFRRGKNKPKEDGKQAPAPTDGKGLNKSAESSESAGGKSAAEPREPSNKSAKSSESAGGKSAAEPRKSSNKSAKSSEIAGGKSAAEPRESSNKSAESPEIAGGKSAAEPREPSNKLAESSESAGGKSAAEPRKPSNKSAKSSEIAGGKFCGITADVLSQSAAYKEVREHLGTGLHPRVSTQQFSPAMRMLYVLAIIMIIDGHIGSSDYLDLNGLLRYQNYHIALFMFVSGYFLNLARGYGEFFKTKAMRLLVPLYAWNAVYGGVCWYLNRYQGFALGGEWNWYNLLYAPLVDGHQFIYNMASWFLVPLFLVQATGFMILKPFSGKDGAAAEENKRQNKWTPVLFFALALGLGCAALAYAPENRGERGITLTALRGLYFLPAFAFGYLYRRTLEKYDRLATPLWLGLLLGGVTLLTGAFPGYNHVPSWLDTINAPGLAIYAISFLAILFWVRVARVLTPVWEKSRTLKYISEHTFDLMMHHFVGFMLAKALFLPFAPGDGAANLARVKSDIWYYPFPGGDENYAWIYIAISMVIALLAGFTSRKIYGIIRRN